MNAQTLYTAQVIGNRLDMVGENLTPCVKIQIKTIENLTTGDFEAKTLVGTLWMTDKAIAYTQKTLSDVFDWAGRSFQELNAPILAGIKLDIVTEIKTNEGREFEEIKWFNKSGMGTVQAMKPLDEDKARAIMAKFDSLLRTNKPTQAKAQPPKQEEANILADDLPF